MHEQLASQVDPYSLVLHNFISCSAALQILPDFKLQILNTNLIIRLLIILIPIALLKANPSKLRSTLQPSAQPLSLRLELDKLQTTAVKLDQLLALWWRGLLIGSWWGEDGC